MKYLKTLFFTFLIVAFAVVAFAQTSPLFRTLHTFDGTDGVYPWATLVQAQDGNFYGTTQRGGDTSCPSGCGVIFKITPGGAFSVLFRFNKTNGYYLRAGLAVGADGALYGVTFYGGNTAACLPIGCGTIFKITLAGELTTLYKFDHDTGAGPLGTLVLATDGNLYGNTSYGGDPFLNQNAGTIFKISSGGVFTVLHSFTFTEGCCAHSALIQAKDGNFYGTEWAGGVYSHGTIYKISPNGIFTLLYFFNGKDGSHPFAGLMQNVDGNFYGTTEEGGAYSYGTTFKLTPEGALTILYSFKGGADGNTPTSELLRGKDGNLYGTASYGGIHPNFGTIYRMTTLGVLTTLYNFNSGDGAYPYGGLAPGINGSLYGATFAGGPPRDACPFGCGTLYRLAIANGTP